MILKRNQQIKVDELTKHSFDILNNKSSSNKIFFSAPTGSGKTFILSKVIWNLINNCEKIVVFFASLSTGKIEKQNFDNYKKYIKVSTTSIDKHFYSYLKSEKNIGTSPTKDIKNINIFSSESKQVYFLGTQLFTKKSLLYRNNILEKELNLFKLNEYKIIYIRDEAHISRDSIYDKTGSENLNNLFQNYANCSIFCSATINSLLSNSNTVIFTEEEAIDDCLIKHNLKNFYGIENDSVLTSENLTEICIKNFIEQQKKYRSLELNINPALLIQIPSKSNIHNEIRERFLIEFLISKLNDYGLNYVIWCDDFYKDIESTNIPELKNKNDNSIIRDYISKNDSIVDVVIFKVALAIGWNIPRANSLLQLRELHSDDLNIQTIGRIRRNPLFPLEKINENEFNFCSEYFIYTNNVTSNIKLKQISLKEEFYIYKIKHPKALNTSINFNHENVSLNIEKLLSNIIDKTNLSNDNSNEHILQKINLVKIHILTNQYFWLNRFFEHYLSILDHKIFLIFNQTINRWIHDNGFLKWKHKIYRKIIDESDNFVKLINNNLDIKHYKNLDIIEEHSLPKLTQVELVLQNNKKLNFVGSRETLSLEKFKNNAFNIHQKWGYNEIIHCVNEFLISNVTNLNDIHLDSKGEYECCDSILKWIIKNDKNYEQTTFFTKHYISSSLIKYPYLFSPTNEIIKIHNTYPDFFLILNNNGEIINVIIEVKSMKQDYDYGKTDAIRRMFEELSKKDVFNNYYFCIYLYNNDEQSRANIQVWANGQKSNFYNISDFLDRILR